MSLSAASHTGFVAFDLEATGLSPKSDRIIEIGAVRYQADLTRTGEMQLVVDPGIPIPLAIQRLVGLGERDVAGAPTPAEALAQFADFAGDAALVVHGGAFDLHLCRSLLPEYFSRTLVFDTLELARILVPTAAGHGLPVLSRLLGIGHERPHRALSDAETTGDLFRWLCVRAATLPERVLGDMRSVVARVEGPLRVFFDEVPQTASGVRPDVRLPRQTRHRTGERDGSSAVAGAEASADAPLEEISARVLAGNGSDEYREAQVQMARAVAQALERRRTLLVEAGTGVGKSRAYLTPLALWSKRTGKRAVVATQTVTLQEQLADRDLPHVVALAGGGVPYAVLKGRHHYISLRRWQRFLARQQSVDNTPSLDAVRFALKVLVWLAETQTGDRSELHLVSEEESYWSWIASDTDDCLGVYCRNWSIRRCHMVAAREAAHEAAIVVTNHALLLAAAERQGQVLAPYDALVIDEAHNLEASATEQLGVALRAADVLRIAERVPARPGSDVADALDMCREATQRLFGDVKGLLTTMLGGENAVNGRVSLSPGVRESPAFAHVVRAARHAVAAMRSAATTLATSAGSALQLEMLPQPGAGTDELTLAAAGLTNASAAVDRIVCNPRPGYVTWLEMRAEQSELHEAPVSVAEQLQDLVFNNVDSAVLTSATLSVAGNFDFVRHRLGLGERADELALDSPFDYLRQAICVLPDVVPPYDDPAHDAVVADLVASVAMRLGGRTLVLFTGYGPLRRVHAMLHDRLEAHGVALLGQGLDGTRKQILNSFLDDARTVLLGTNSFWEGVDIPGDHLQCVVIDKLPFAVPTDPLVRARTDGLRDPFLQYVLPLAVIKLRQGFGRLIRSSTDRGAVVLCDERLARRDYGDVFLRALPPAVIARVSNDELGLVVERFITKGEAVEAMAQSARGR